MRDPSPVPFLETTRSLHSRNNGNTSLAVVAILLLAGWGGWAVLARLGVYDTSRSARVEIPGTAAVETPIAGAVQESRLALGSMVRAGDRLVAIEVQSQTLELEAQRASNAGIERQVDLLVAQLTSSQQALDHAAAGWLLETRQNEMELQRAESARAEARTDLETRRRLHAEGIETALELRRAEAEWVRQASLADQARLNLARIQEEHTSALRDRESDLATLRERIEDLETSRSTSDARARSLRHEIERRWIRAPVDGRVGELAELERGRYLSVGTRVCTIVPAGSPRVVAMFDAESLGRIRKGQSGRLRLDGFPSTRYGSVGVRVREVGGELREGRLRVELSFDDSGHLPVDLGHGYPGSVEIQTDRVSPLGLVLRFAGRRIAATPES